MLRHRIVRHQADARRKYLNRRFQAEEVQRGWHRTRLRLSARQLTFPDAAELEQFTHPDQRKLDRRYPHRQHYWHWPEASKTRPSRSVVCLYGCEADAALLETFYNSPLWTQIRQRKDTLLLEVWGGSTSGDQFDGRRLTLDTPEDYGQLSLKTLQMLRWCSRQLRMKQLIKLDLSSIRIFVFARLKACDGSAGAQALRGQCCDEVHLIVVGGAHDQVCLVDTSETEGAWVGTVALEGCDIHALADLSNAVTIVVDGEHLVALLGELSGLVVHAAVGAVEYSA